MATVIVREGCLLVRGRASTSSWPLAQVIWLQASGHQTRLHTTGGAELVGVTLASFAHWLPRDGFLRINRSIIVNRRHVASSTTGSRGSVEIALSDGTRLMGVNHRSPRRFTNSPVHVCGSPHLDVSPAPAFASSRLHQRGSPLQGGQAWGLFAKEQPSSGSPACRR
jgi:hypothetical protein